MQTKINAIKKHLTKKKHITSWEAIVLYKATRLSAIIFNLKKSGWDIATNKVTVKGEKNQTTTYAKYVLIKSPAKK